MKKGPAFKCLQTTSDAGERPRDPRPTIDKAREIEAIPQGERTMLQREALDQFEIAIGDAGERAETAGRFAKRVFGRDDQDAGEFLALLKRAGLDDEANAIAAAVIAGLERMGPYTPTVDQRKRN